MPFQPFTDTELGLITVKPHSRARSFIFRATKEGIQITCPLHVTQKQIKEAFAQQRQKLQRLVQKKQQEPLLKKDVVFLVTGFKIYVAESGYGNLFQARYSDEVLELVCPCRTDYNRAEVQEFFFKNVTKVARYKAERYLPNRLNEYALKLGLKYKSCRVSYGKSRLGRCDSHGEILLSYRLMLLPSHLCDYVILHELAHLKEMNHGSGFHQLLDTYCQGNHRNLEKELKNYRYPI
ncbi:MAG: M48 family metallopeptidase [Bacteroidales bacterium]